MEKMKITTELLKGNSKKGKTYYLLKVYMSNDNGLKIELCHYFLSDKDIALMGL